MNRKKKTYIILKKPSKPSLVKQFSQKGWVVRPFWGVGGMHQKDSGKFHNQLWGRKEKSLSHGSKYSKFCC